MATNVKQLPQLIIAGDTLLSEIVSLKYTNTAGYFLSLQAYGPSGSPQGYTFAAIGIIYGELCD